MKNFTFFFQTWYYVLSSLCARVCIEIKKKDFCQSISILANKPCLSATLFPSHPSNLWHSKRNLLNHDFLLDSNSSKFVELYSFWMKFSASEMHWHGRKRIFTRVATKTTTTRNLPRKQSNRKLKLNWVSGWNRILCSEWSSEWWRKEHKHFQLSTSFRFVAVFRVFACMLNLF